MRTSIHKHTVYLAVICLLALLVRAYPLVRFDYPTGADYGHHLYYGDLYLDQGRFPSTIPRFQLGQSDWSTLPGGSLIFASLSALSGLPALSLGVMVLWVIVPCEIVGVYLLARKLIGLSQAGLFAALVVATLPAGTDMLSWAAYPNAIAIALAPLVFYQWASYWDAPTRVRGLLTALITCGCLSIHHLSTLWMAFALILFGIVMLVRAPARTLRTLFPLGVACILIGWPIWLTIIELTLNTDATTVLTQADRFIYTRIGWYAWVNVLTPLAFVLLVGGVPAVLRQPQANDAARVLVLAYLVVGLVMGFGWLLNLTFFYQRALFFLSVPTAILGAAFVYRLVFSSWARGIFQVVLVMTLAISIFWRQEVLASYYRSVTSQTVQAADWLQQNSTPDDVIVVGTFLGFHATWMFERPTLVGLSPDLVGNPQELEQANAAYSILMGLPSMNEVIDRYGVRYVFVRVNLSDTPDPIRSRFVLDAHPRMTLAYANDHVLIYRVDPMTTAVGQN